MLTQTGPRTNTMLPSFAFVRLPMSTFETTARRRPATVLLPHPSLADMLDTIKRSDPIRYAAIHASPSSSTDTRPGQPQMSACPSKNSPAWLDMAPSSPQQGHSRYASSLMGRPLAGVRS